MGKLIRQLDAKLVVKCEHNQIIQSVSRVEPFDALTTNLVMG